jgi:hypothetical protein
MKIKKHQKNNSQKGFVILFAVLISSLVLSVGISIISISLKQIVLSGSGRDSQFAFYMSNTGAECAQYWDYAGDLDTTTGNKSNVFATSSDSTLSFNITRVKCLGMTLATTTGGRNQNSGCDPQGINNYPGWCVDENSSNNSAKTKFRIQYADKPYCADVIVTKTANGITGSASTTIISRGYNTCDQNNTRRIQRALQFSY